VDEGYPEFNPSLIGYIVSHIIPADLTATKGIGSLQGVYLRDDSGLGLVSSGGIGVVVE
jgi:hypothetical protein